MRKNIKLPFKLLLAMMLAIVLTISVGLSIWLITDRIEIKPELDVNKVITRYLDDLSADYLKDTVSLPSNSAVGLEPGSEELTYYYKMIKDSDGNDVSNLDENKNYALVEGQNGPKNAGTYSIKVEYLLIEDTNPDDNIDDSVVITEEVTFVINKAKINMDGISFDGEELTYDKNHHNIIISGTLPKDEKGNTLISDVVYTCGGNPFSGATNAGTYNVTASFVYDEKNYETVNSMDATLKINEKALNLSTLTFKDNPNKIFYHTGNTIDEISSSLIVTDDDGAILKEGEDYTVKFSDVVNLGTDHKVTITGIKNYSGTSSTTYTIKEKVYNLIIKPNYQSGAAYEVVSYNGQIQRPSVTVTDEDNNILDGVSLSYDVDSKNKGTYKINVTATKEGYITATKEITLLIQPINLTFTWSNNSFTYDKGEHIPTLVVDGILDIDKENYKINLVSPQVNAGTYTAKAEISNNTAGNYVLPNNDEYNFTISPRPVTFVSSSYGISYNSSYRTWNDIKSLAAKELTFNNVMDGDDVGATLIGMHNGIYSYGTVTGNNLDNSMTNVVGSTYQATVSLTNSNYTIIKNTFIFKYKTAKVSSVDNLYFTIEDAFNQTGTITLAGDASNDTSHVITCFTKLTGSQGNPYNKIEFKLTGRTLLIPYEDSLNEKHHAEGNPDSGFVYAALIIPKDISINASSNAHIIAGAKIGYNQNITATVAANRGVLINNGTITCGSGTSSDISSVKAYGYIKGDGEITINKYSKGYESMSIYDFAGGTAALKVQSDVLPMNSWSIHNNSCKTKVMSGAEYYGFVYLELSIVGGVDAEFFAIGSKAGQNCIFIPNNVNDDTYIVKYADIADEWKKDPTNYTDLDTITGINQIRGQKDIIELHGAYTDSSFKIKVSMANLSTAKGESKPCPISFMDIIIKNGGSFNVSNSDYLFLPGAACTVENGGSLTIGKGCHVTFATWEDISALSGGFNTRCIDKEDADLIINGTLNVLGQLAGKITTESSGAVLTIGNEAKLTTSANIYNDNPVGTVSTLAPSATANILDGELSINASYVSEEYASAPEGEDKYWWRAASSIKYIKIILYDDDGTTELDTIIIQVVNSDTYIVDGENFTASKLHYRFNSWLTMDNQAFTTATLQAVTKEELEAADSSYEPLKLKAVWDLQPYEFNFIASYGQDEYGNLNYITEKDGLVLNDKVGTFTINSFENDVISIPTIAEYKVGDSNKFMDGWYVGIDKSTGIRLSSLTKDQFEAILENQNGGTTITLYCEFTDNEYFNVVITDDKHQLISQGYLIEGGKSIISSSYSIPSFDTSDYDDDPNVSYFFNGFIDENNNVYTLEQLEKEPITSNMTFKVNWSEKFSLIYDDGVTVHVKPGLPITLRESAEKEDLEGTSYITKYIFQNKWTINGTEYTGGQEFTSTNQIGGEVTATGVYSEEYWCRITVTLTTNANGANTATSTSGLNLSSDGTASFLVKKDSTVEISGSRDWYGDVGISGVTPTSSSGIKGSWLPTTKYSFKFKAESNMTINLS